MDGVAKRPGSGWTQRGEAFEVSGKPDFYVPRGTHKNTLLRPQMVIISWYWPDPMHENSVLYYCQWKADLGGQRVLRNDKLGAYLSFQFTAGNRSIPRPAWLLDVVREFGPEGWVYGDH